MFCEIAINLLATVGAFTLAGFGGYCVWRMGVRNKPAPGWDYKTRRYTREDPDSLDESHGPVSDLFHVGESPNRTNAH